MNSPIEPDSDRPLDAEDKDQFGFVGIARGLAPALLKTLDGDGMVVGLEGQWGSGKTTLLNYLRTELQRTKADDVHVISLAPWLSGDTSNLVSSLIEPIADVIEAAEEAMPKSKSQRSRQAKESRDSLGSILRSYGAKTSRNLAPAVHFAEHFIPGAKIMGDALELGASYLEQTFRQPTTAETKIEISRKISKLGISFLVILDDLDRLEPAQAVEIVRLVRSVADFPKITYLMCYDRDILSQALSNGLSLKDGDLFLQKIVQLTFSIPLPEPFDLRKKFLDDALEIFSDITGRVVEGEILDDLKQAVDQEGAGLRTPREVKLALNGLRFIYPAISEDVYFPDMCRLHLIKTVKPRLYRWLEEYLSVRSVLVTGDASVGDDEKTRLGSQLSEILPSDEIGSTRSIWSLRRFIPGVIKSEVEKSTVFSETSRREVQDMIRLRRLGSPIHYRYYFALTPPKTVMPDEEFSSLLVLAKADPNKLKQEFVRLANERRTWGRTWFEHVLDRLDDAQIGSLDGPTAYGLVVAVSDAMDTVLKSDNEPRPFSAAIKDKAFRVVEDCLKELKSKNFEEFRGGAEHLAANCLSLNWIVGTFFRAHIWSHGLVGDQPKPPELWIFSEVELDALLEKLRDRVAEGEVQNQINDMPDVASYLFGWRDLAGVEDVKAWVKEFSKTDEGFLMLLSHLRSWAMGDKVYYPLKESSVSAFFDWEETVKRLDGLSESKFSDTVSELEVAIKQGKH